MRVVLLTGPAGSGKTTTANAIVRIAGWISISEDDIWHRLFGKNRGAFGTDEHRRKRAQVHAVVFDAVLAADREVVIDATVHESPPEAYREYAAWFAEHEIDWELHVLRPRLDVAIARDAARRGWTLGAESVAGLYAKFDGSVFDARCVIDNSDEPPEATARRITLRPCPPG